MATSALGSPRASSEARPRSRARRVALRRVRSARRRGRAGQRGVLEVRSVRSGLFAARVEGAIGQRDHVKGIDDLGGFGQNHAVDGGVDVGHVEGPEVTRDFQASLWWSKKPATSTNLRVGRMSMIWWCSTSVTVVAYAGVMSTQLHETGLIQADGAGAIEAFLVGRERASP